MPFLQGADTRNDLAQARIDARRHLVEEAGWSRHRICTRQFEQDEAVRPTACGEMSATCVIRALPPAPPGCARSSGAPSTAAASKFSRTVMLVKGVGIWKVRPSPIPRDHQAGMRDRRPPSLIVPLVGAIVPESRLKSVLLPLPFGPMMPTISPSCRVRDASFRMFTPGMYPATVDRVEQRFAFGLAHVDLRAGQRLVGHACDVAHFRPRCGLVPAPAPWDYALILQGMGVGVFYLTALSAMKLHNLIPNETGCLSVCRFAAQPPKRWPFCRKRRFWRSSPRSKVSPRPCWSPRAATRCWRCLLT